MAQAKRFSPFFFTRIASLIAAALFSLDLGKAAILYFAGESTTAQVTERRDPRHVVITYRYETEGKIHVGSATYDWLELAFAKPPQEGDSIGIRYSRRTPEWSAPENSVIVSGLLSLLWVALLLTFGLSRPTTS